MTLSDKFIFSTNNAHVCTFIFFFIEKLLFSSFINSNNHRSVFS